MYIQKNLNTLNSPQMGRIKNEDIDEILRGEISATEAYEQVMDKVNHDSESYRLRQFKLDHENAVQYWRKEASVTGKIPESGSNIWGTAVELFVGISKLVGEDTALRALRAGEEHGLSNYEKMLKSDRLTRSQKDEIRNVFIPRQKRHIESINAMLSMH